MGPTSKGIGRSSRPRVGSYREWTMDGLYCKGSGGERQARREGAREGWHLATRTEIVRASLTRDYAKDPTGFPGSCYPGTSNETAGTLGPGFFLGGVCKFQP